MRSTISVQNLRDSGSMSKIHKRVLLPLSCDSHEHRPCRSASHPLPSGLPSPNSSVGRVHAEVRRCGLWRAGRQPLRGCALRVRAGRGAHHLPRCELAEAVGSGKGMSEISRGPEGASESKHFGWVHGVSEFSFQLEIAKAFPNIRVLPAWLGIAGSSQNSRGPGSAALLLLRRAARASAARRRSERLPRPRANSKHRAHGMKY